jgi:O-antigen ligase
MLKITLVAICAFVAFMPFEMMAAFEELPSGAKMAGIGCVCAAMLSILMGHPLRLLSLPMVIRIVLFAYSCFSVAWSIQPDSTIGTIPRNAQLVVFIVLVWEFAVTYKDHMWILRSLLVGMLVPLLMGAAATRTNVDLVVRYAGGGQDANYLAYMYSVSVLVAVYLGTNSLPLDRYGRYIYWALAILFALATVRTGSRGGFLCLLFAGLFVLLLAGVARRRILAILQVSAVIGLVALVVWTIVPAELITRATFSGGGASLEEDPRLHIWRDGFNAFLQYPIAGTGLGTYYVVTGATGKAYVAHNTFISVLVELGLIGIGLFATFTYMLFRAAWRMPKREKWFWTGVLVVWLIGALTSGSPTDKFSWFVHVMVLVQAVACTQPRAVRRTVPSPGRATPAVRRPLPRFNRP